MKAFTHIFILSSLLTLWGCSEEISEEIQNDNPSTPTSGGDGSVVVPTLEGSAIRVTNSLSGSYIMHKASSLEEACEIPSPADGFDSANYANNDPATAIDCILDAEEFDLFFGGAELNIQVDPNLCEYIDYQPFKFFNWQPGFTTREVYRVECDDFCAGETPAICNRTYATYDSVTNTLSNEIANTNLAAICRFNYTDEVSGLSNGPNCDSGSVTTTVIDYTSETDTADPPITSCPVLPTVSSPETTSCGGELSACYGGAATETNNLEINEQSLIVENPSLSSIEESFQLPAPFTSDLSSNMDIANFSRVCSSVGNIKFDGDFDSALVDIQGDQIETISSTNLFEPIAVDEEEDGNIDYFITANHPFNGVAVNSRPSNDVIPYYSIKCLDSARDIKAQVRVHIREWDRVIDPTNIFISRLSDINQGVNARMDARGDQGPANPWNDFFDWDDLLSDFDINAIVDANSNDGAGFADPVFINNQCLDLNTGYCFDQSAGAFGSVDTGLTNETICEGTSVNNRWIPSRESFPEFRN